MTFKYKIIYNHNNTFCFDSELHPLEDEIRNLVSTLLPGYQVAATYYDFDAFGVPIGVIDLLCI